MIHRVAGFLSQIFLNGLDDGVIIAGEGVEDLLKGVEEGDSANGDLRAELEKLSQKYDPPDFRLADLRRDVTADMATLREMAQHVEPITPDKDAKLQRLLKWLDAEPLLRSHKLLIFTQYIDTAQYITDQLRAAKVRPPETIEHADSSRDDLQTLVSRFAPIANADTSTLACSAEAGSRRRREIDSPREISSKRRLASGLDDRISRGERVYRLYLPAPRLRQAGGLTADQLKVVEETK